MLVLSRSVGESVVISNRFQVMVAVIGERFVDLCVTERDGRRTAVVTLYDHELRAVVAGVRGIMIRRSESRVRLGFEPVDGESIRRGDFDTDGI